MEEFTLSSICEEAESLVEEDIDDILPDVVRHYQSRIAANASRAYGVATSTVARSAFTEQARQTIRNGLYTFLIVKKHWIIGRDLNTYLLTCLKRLADQIHYDQEVSKRTNAPICPGCKELGQKVYLLAEDKLWRCPSCTSEADRLSDDDRKGKFSGQEQISTRVRIRLHNLFALHSRKGYRCAEPDCNRFIPDSIKTEFGIACPYPDCGFFGSIEELHEMTHPSGVSRRQNYSLNSKLKSSNSSSNETEFGDLFEADVIRPDEQIAFFENFQKELKVLLSVIDSQMDTVRRTNSNATREQKLLMYEAFKGMCQKHPEEMVSYLVHQSQSGDFPIQARVFQSFISLVEDSLPFTIDKHGESIEIMSLSDPDLGLFSGYSEYEAIVGEDGVIPNNTIETYTGGRKYKNHGSYYLGRLVDVADTESGSSVMEHVLSHSFIEIYSSLPEGTKVKVSHYRIPPHYEMGAMVFLQRIRRLIVDKVYFRLHGVKRQPARRLIDEEDIDENSEAA